MKQTMMIVDAIVNLDSIHLKDGETMDDVIDYLKERWEFGYEPQYEVTYEEIVDD